MDPKEIEQHLRNLIIRLWNEGDMDAADELFRKQVVMHLPQWRNVIGIEAYQGYIAEVHELFPDLRVHIQEMVVEVNHVAVRYSWTGTCAGGETAKGYAPAGAEIAMQGMGFYHLVQNQITVGWAMEDWLSLYEQLGLLPERVEQAA